MPAARITLPRFSERLFHFVADFSMFSRSDV